MSARRVAQVAWSVWALAVALWAAYFLLRAAGGFATSPGEGTQSTVAGVFLRLAYGLVFLTTSTIGALISSRHPAHPIGWLSAAAGLLVSLDLLVGEYATSAALAPAGALAPGAAVVAWTGTLLSGNPVLVAPVLLLFPDGRLPSRRWAPVLWLAVVSAALAVTSLALQPGPLGNAPAIENPFGLPGAAETLGVLLNVATVGLPLSILLSALALGLRFRRSHGEERQQLKWVTYAAALWALGLAGNLAAPAAWRPAANLAYVLLLSVFVATLGIAMLKYRLYDVDLVINKTLAYGILAVCVTGVYAAVVDGLGAAAGAGTSGLAGLLGSGSGDPLPLPPLLATVVVALAFQPLRDRLQRLANRMVYGRAADPAKVLAEYAERMAHAVSVKEILPQTAEVVGRGVGAAVVRVQVFHTADVATTAAWPAPALSLATWSAVPDGARSGAEQDGPAETIHELLPADQAAGHTSGRARGDLEFTRLLPVLHYGEVIGEIAVAMRPGQTLSAAEVRLLNALAAQAGPALRNARLTSKLHLSLDEISAQAQALRASRERLVAAQDAARRRLERDIHDGAQQHLVALAVTARLARQLVERHPQRAAAMLDDVLIQANEALATIRELARGIFPPLLGDRGVAAALGAQMARARPLAELHVDAQTVALRFEPGVEAGVYFCCLEALQNASKHAPEAHVVVHLAHDGDVLRFSVHDDGPGFDAPAAPPGTGLQNMADRIAAIGGTVEVTSAPGQGTSVVGRVPALPVPAPHSVSPDLVAR